MDIGDGRDDSAARARRDEQDDEPIRDLLDEVDDDDGRSFGSGARDEPPPFITAGEFQEGVGEQADFREQFDEDLYNDREDRPAQGNTADVAMGDHRFGSDAAAYGEYAYRRAGDHHRGDESAVGQARDPSDGGGEDERP